MQATALWKLGFRPFFLFGAAFALLQVGSWATIHATGLQPAGLRDPLLWHAHEMIFGYAAAVVAGFLLTATQNWTGIRGVHGYRLQLLTGVWLLARILAPFDGSLPRAFALADLSFFPLLAWLLKPYLWQKSQRNNQVFFVFFLVLFLLNMAFHARELAWLPPRSALLGAVYIVLLILALVGGRVIPFFSSVVLPRAQLRANRWIERLSFVSLALLAFADCFLEFTSIAAVLAFAAALAQGARFLLWKPWLARKIPILFVLHVGYAWLPVGLLLRGFASLGWIAPSISTHAFTTGCIGIVVYGMITRVSLGHSGRMMKPHPLIVAGYVLVTLSALLRVAGPALLPELALRFVEASAALWALAHGIFLAIYAPILLSPRADGKEG